MNASDFLKEAERLIDQRGEEYDGDAERSVPAAVLAFNAITGKNISVAEGWLFLEILKNVRQWSYKRRNGDDTYHYDSAVDALAYAALKAEELSNER